MQIQVRSSRVITIVTAGNSNPPSVSLIPGINSIPSNVWDMVKNTSVVQQLSDNKTFVVLETEDGPTSEVLKLKGRSSEQAKEIIEDITDPEILADWEMKETKPEIKKVIKDQRKKIAGKS